jgi:hypothetical protein
MALVPMFGASSYSFRFKYLLALVTEPFPWQSRLV